MRPAQLEQSPARTFVFAIVGNAHREAPVPWSSVILNCALSLGLDPMDDSSPMCVKPLQCVVLDVTGGIPAYGAAELTPLFVEEGIAVTSRGATQFIAPMSTRALTLTPTVDILSTFALRAKPPYLAGVILPRSGTGHKHGIVPGNLVGSDRLGLSGAIDGELAGTGE
jgi:hypothetical protein